MKYTRMALYPIKSPGVRGKGFGYTATCHGCEKDVEYNDTVRCGNREFEKDQSYCRPCAAAYLCVHNKIPLMEAIQTVNAIRDTGDEIHSKRMHMAINDIRTSTDHKTIAIIATAHAVGQWNQRMPEKKFECGKEIRFVNHFNYDWQDISRLWTSILGTRVRIEPNAFWLGDKKWNRKESKYVHDFIKGAMTLLLKKMEQKNQEWELSQQKERKDPLQLGDPLEFTPCAYCGELECKCEDMKLAFNKFKNT